jgi:ATP-dependent RNA helicase RhlB
VINDLLNNPIQERFRGEPRALILAPTRELALQIESDAKDLTKFTDLHVTLLVVWILISKKTLMRILLILWLQHQVV